MQTRTIAFGALVASLLGSSACSHKTCLSHTVLTRQESYCCPGEYHDGYCHSTCFRDVDSRVCSSWQCESGYHRSGNRCVPGVGPLVGSTAPSSSDGTGAAGTAPAQQAAAAASADEAASQQTWVALGVTSGTATDSNVGAAFGAMAAVEFPLSGQWAGYAAFDYFAFSLSRDEYSTAMGSSTYVDEEFDYISLNPGVSYWLKSQPWLVLRGGVSWNRSNAYVQYGMCGTSYLEDEFSSTSFGLWGGAAARVQTWPQLEFGAQAATFGAEMGGYCSEPWGGMAASLVGYSGRVTLLRAHAAVVF